MDPAAAATGGGSVTPAVVVFLTVAPAVFDDDDALLYLAGTVLIFPSRRFCNIFTLPLLGFSSTKSSSSEEITMVATRLDIVEAEGTTTELHWMERGN